MKALWSRIWASILCVGGLAAGSHAAGRETGLMSAKLAAAEKSSDFFLFFNFAPIAREKQPDGAQVTSFKPTGDAFKALVTLIVTTDGQDNIRSLRLVISRSFIDDPAKCVYAADLAKSFLGNAAGTTHGNEVDALAREISARAISRTTVTMLTAQPVPTASGPPSAAYQTYAGGSDSQTLLYTSGLTQLVLNNGTNGTERVLDLTVSSKP